MISLYLNVRHPLAPRELQNLSARALPPVVVDVIVAHEGLCTQVTTVERHIVYCIRCVGDEGDVGDVGVWEMRRWRGRAGGGEVGERWS